MKLKTAAYRHIEAEICAYHDTLEAMEELNRDIILANWHRSASTRPAERTLFAKSVLLRGMERITQAIADTYAQAKEECRQVLWVKYGLALEGWQPPENIQARMEGRNRSDLTTDEMAEILLMDRATFHRYRTGFIYGVAKKLGWTTPS